MSDVRESRDLYDSVRELIELIRRLPDLGITVVIIEHTMNAMVQLVDRFVDLLPARVVAFSPGTSPVAGRTVTIDVGADDGVGADLRDQLGELRGLARAEVRGRVRVRPALEHGVQHHGAGGLGERRELAQRDLRELGLRAGPHPDEHHTLEAQLPVLDLGDVLELGGQTGNAAQRGPLLAVELVAVDVVVLDGVLLQCGPRTRQDAGHHVLRRVGRLDRRCVVVLCHGLPVVVHFSQDPTEVDGLRPDIHSRAVGFRGE